MSARFVRLAIAATVLFVPAFASAQQGFDIQKFRPAHGPHALFSQEAADTAGAFSPTGGLMLNFASAPFVRSDGDEITQTIIEQQLAMHVMLGMGLTDHVDLQFDLPVYLSNDGIGLDGESIDGTEAGDLRIRTKASFLSSLDGGFGLGAAFDLGLPSGADEVYVGSGGITASPRLIFDYRVANLLLAANLGANFRPDYQVENLEIGSDFTYGAGAELAFMRGLLYLTGEVYGGTPLDNFFGENQSALEGLLGAKVAADQGFHVSFAMGGGLVPGEGSSEFRAILGVQYARRTLDYDQDGLENRDDACPAEAEDLDGFEDSDGCPDKDNDIDGVADEADACPDDPEDLDGFEDEDGCPDLDNDGDTIPDDKDTCPMEAEDTDGFQDEDGCPDKDNDGDEIADADDQCPDEAEDLDQFKDEDGCPEPDNDLDGVLDDDDVCPVEPGLPEDNGCPPKETKAVLEGNAIKILDKVFFETGKATIKQESFGLLDQVALVLRTNPQVTKIEIAGHTDSRGNDDANMKLSQERAESVAKYLTDKGIASERLVAKGYGETKPLEDGRSRAALAKNRRVEFNILEQPGAEAEAADEADDRAEGEPDSSAADGEE